MNGFAPWQQRVWDRALEARANGRLPHALLICGPERLGKRVFAEALARLLLCPGSSAGVACGTCASCRQFDARFQRDPVETRPDESPAHPDGHPGHPDARFVGFVLNEKSSPKKMYQELVIDQIRELSSWLVLSPQHGTTKVALIEPAHQLTVPAANALLKTLEEPPPRTLVMLVTSQPSRLMPTLRSRCSKLRLVGPSRADAAEFLAAAKGAGPWEEALAATGLGPFALLDADPAALAELRADTVRTLREIGSGEIQPPAVAEKWARGDLATRLACVESWVTDRILESASIRDVTHLSVPAATPNICRLFEISDAVRDMRKLSLTPINKTMAVEALLWRWAR